MYGEQKDSEATAKGMIAELELRALEGREAKAKNADDAIKEMKEADGKTTKAKAAYEKAPNDAGALLAYYRALHNERVAEEKNDRVLQENGKHTKNAWALLEKEGTILAEADPSLKTKFLDLIRNEPDRAEIVERMERGERNALIEKNTREHQEKFDKALLDLRKTMEFAYDPKSLGDAEKSINGLLDALPLPFEGNKDSTWLPDQDTGKETQDTVDKAKTVASCLKLAVQTNEAFERAVKDSKEVDFAKKMLVSEQKKLIKTEPEIKALFGTEKKYPWIQDRLGEIAEMNKKLEK